MADNKPRGPGRKTTLIPPLAIAGVVLAIVVGAVLFNRSHEKSAPSPSPVAQSVPPVPAAPSPKPPLGRTDILHATSDAAAAFAAGASPKDEALAGRTFDLSIPFGCEGPGPSSSASQTSVEFDPQKLTVKLSAQPADWSSLPMMQELSGLDQLEAIEGLWIPRPWTYAQGCPPKRDQRPPATPTPPTPQSVGLAELFGRGGSRLLRRDGRPYTLVRKITSADREVLSHPYRLQLSGHVDHYPDGRTLHCWSESADHRPICILAVVFDRVAFEDQVTHQVLAEWTR